MKKRTIRNKNEKTIAKAVSKGLRKGIFIKKGNTLIKVYPELKNISITRDNAEIPVFDVGNNEFVTVSSYKKHWSLNNKI